MIRCKHCNYEFNEYSFSYRAKQVCPKCHAGYRMIFPTMIGFIPLILALLPGAYTLAITDNYMSALSIYLITYFAFDAIIASYLIYRGNFKVVEEKRK